MGIRLLSPIRCRTCTKKLLIQRKKAEEFILSHLKDQLLSVENLKYIYDTVEKEVLRSLNEVPEELKQKRCQQEKIQAELQNLLNFIKAGNFSKVVSEAITDAEGRSQKVQDVLDTTLPDNQHLFDSFSRCQGHIKQEVSHERSSKKTKKFFKKKAKVQR